LSLADLPLTDWRSIFQPGNLLSFAGIAATVYYALRAEKKAGTALEAALSARRSMLANFAAEEFTELLHMLQSLRKQASDGNVGKAEEIAQQLNTSLAMAKTSWSELREI